MNLGVCSLMNFLTYLCPEELFQYSRALSANYFAMDSATFLFVVPHDGITPRNSLAALSLVSTSAFLFSLILWYPGTQAWITLLCSPRSFRAQALSHISRDVILTKLTAFITAMLLVAMAMGLCIIPSLTI